MNKLKPLRVIISLIFFISTSIIFLDYLHLIPREYVKTILYMQFVPSFLNFISGKYFLLSGFIIVIILTILFGRIYCSSICPFGTMMDIIAFIKRKIFPKSKYKFIKAQNILRYSILILVIFSIFAGTSIALNLLDPYSNFGRMFNQIFLNPVLYLNNFIFKLIDNNNLYWIQKIEIMWSDIKVLAYPVIFLTTILTLSILAGRLYCNTICPVGSFLSLLSKYPFFKLSIERSQCNSCGSCGIVCKSECINLKSQEIDLSRCVACFNCIKSCPENSFKYKFKLNDKVQEDYDEEEFDVNLNRRSLIRNSTLAIGSTLLIGCSDTNKDDKEEIDKIIPITPPGSISQNHFLSKCTSCNLCVVSCPTKVLKPSFFEYGVLGFQVPKMDYHSSFCNYNCVVCSNICPTGAIKPLLHEEKKVLQIGKVNLFLDLCVVYTEDKDCGACSEHCPTKAVFMVPYNDLFAPETNEEICIGCGACEFACPAKPEKAIFVVSNRVHQKAKKPVIKKADDSNIPEDFPF